MVGREVGASRVRRVMYIRHSTGRRRIELQGRLKRIENQIHPQSREECDELRAKASDKPDYGARIVNGVQVSYHDGDIVAVYEVFQGNFFKLLFR